MDTCAARVGTAYLHNGSWSMNAESALQHIVHMSVAVKTLLTKEMKTLWGGEFHRLLFIGEKPNDEKRTI
jgi:hypothetical protein